MVNILIAGHGRFASGLLSSLELIMGKQEYVCAVDFPQEDTKAELDVKIQAALTRVSPSDEVIAFCDLRGGISLSEYCKYSRSRQASICSLRRQSPNDYRGSLSDNGWCHGGRYCEKVHFKWNR